MIMKRGCTIVALECIILTMARNPLTIYSVSQINAMVSSAVEQGLPPRMIVHGQIGDFKVHSSGHCYFSLKDQGSILPCVMWASKAKAIKFRPQNGIAVLATGSVEVYVPGGKYQFYAEKLDPAGVGALQLAFEQLKQKLQNEGLFEPAHKKSLPRFAMRMGIITSASGAAVEDIRDSIFKRWPCAKLFLFDVPVQGEGAARKIADAIREANRMRKQLGLEMLIVGRGGGSMEDLWAFNEEVVARAIFNSELPVISAVGHEVDFTIADFVADVRASTPTQAGVVAVPDVKEVLAGLHSAQKRLSGTVQGQLRHLKQQLQTILADAIFRQPQRVLENNVQRLDEMISGLKDALRDKLDSAARIIQHGEMAVVRIEPRRFLSAGQTRLVQLESRARRAFDKCHSEKLLQMTAVQNRLQALNPKAVLERGYSITTSRRTGRVITAATEVKPGDTIITELARQQQIESVVEKILPNKQDS
ncbi:MAG: exodeoxyribonuclease VII large subunit [Planctomycetes bacterium]|nr:exodeoxyribonuclease VII large subunit [Planctomycetota bacterium]